MAEPTENKCGACRLCCTVMKVELDPPEDVKPAGTKCSHLCSTGCRIYETRPAPCSGFECLWLSSQRWPELAFPSQERPDRTNVVLEINTKNVVVAHCRTPEAWRDPRIIKRMKALLNGAVPHVIIEHGNGRVSLYENEGLTPMREVGIDPVTNETKYVRDLLTNRLESS